MLENKEYLPELLILGAGGYGQAVAEVAKLLNRWSKIYFVDDQWPEKKKIKGIDVVSNIKSLHEYCYGGNYQAIAAVGNNNLRRVWHERVKALSIPLTCIIHPSSTICHSAKIGEGVSIMAGCVISANVIIEDGVILNIGVLLDHDVRVKEYAHLSVGVKCAGGLVVQGDSFWKTGSIITHECIN